MQKETQKAYQAVLNEIKQQIEQGDLKVGQKILSERAMTEKLGLSRNSVREALRQLENMGFVNSVHGQGSFLINNAQEGFAQSLSMLLLMNQSSKSEVLELRKVLELAALEKAINQPDTICSQQMKAALEKMEAAQTVQQIQSAEEQFHCAMMSQSNNRLFEMILAAFSGLNKQYQKETLEQLNQNEKEQLIDIHKQILCGLQTKNKKQAKQAMEEHFCLVQQK